MAKSFSFILILSLTTTILLLCLCPQESSGACCTPNAQFRCKDESAGKPCCGCGSCNMFCCNCNGCRTRDPHRPSCRQGRSLGFGGLDIDEDGGVSLEDLKAWAASGHGNQTLGDQDLLNEFNRRDKDGDGLLSEEEINTP